MTPESVMTMGRTAMEVTLMIVWDFRPRCCWWR